MSAHDRWLANFRTGVEHVWCEKPGCVNHVDGVEVRWVSEYGQSWWEPEECFLCHGGWVQDEPGDVPEGPDEFSPYADVNDE